MTAATPPSEAAKTGAAAGADAGSVMACAVKLPVFEGPLDLLLHLIRVNEVEITDIPVARIAEQYVAYLELMRELNLDVAGEYLLMAATLAWIKSRMLLPPQVEELDEEAADPRAELVARLLEYQRFKEVSVELGERPLLGRDVFDARRPEPETIPDAEREIEVGLFELVQAFHDVLKRAGPSGLPHEVEVETITVAERMQAVMEALEERETLEFEVMLRSGGELPSRAIIVTSFLAILELTRLEALALYQGVDEASVPRGPIHLRRLAEPGGPGWRERISELM